MTLRTGAARPRNGDAVYTPEPGGVLAWKLSELGANAILEVHDAEREGPLYVSVPTAGGTARIRELSSTRSEDLVLGSPLAARFAYFWRTVGGNGILQGRFRTYASAWVTGLGFVTGFSDVVKIENDALHLSYVTHTGQHLVTGGTVTNTTLGKTAVAHGVSTDPVGGTTTFLIRESEKSAPGAWASGNTVTWDGGSAALGGAEAPTDAQAFFLPPLSPPPEACGWVLYGLEEETGYWRRISNDEGEGGWPLGDVRRGDTTWFPFADDQGIHELSLYDGPLDLSGLPETLLPAIAEAHAATVHKGCLFVAEGEVIRYSEPFRPRLFRAWAKLNAGGTVLSLVSRSAVVEVYTALGVCEIRGDSPTFELCDLGIRQGPVAAASIVATEGGTFALYADGVYAYADGLLRNLTAGVHTSWIFSLERPEAAVAGARLGVYYLVAEDGEALCYDWRNDEWFHRKFSPPPLGFLPEPVHGAVAKTEETCLIPEGGDGPVAWAVEWGGGGDGLSRPAPGRVFLDVDGEAWVELLVDGERVCRFPAPETPGYVRLPFARGRRWSICLDGVGCFADVAVKEVRHG
jgi:hypothetical protein